MTSLQDQLDEITSNTRNLVQPERLAVGERAFLSSMATRASVCRCPATYVISKDGKVIFAEAHADFRVRPEPEEALAAACDIHHH